MLLNFDTVVTKTIPIMIVVLYCHYLFDKLLGIPIGYIVLVSIISLATIKLITYHRISRKWIIPFGINLLFIIVVVLSIFVGKINEGRVWNGITTDMVTGWFGGLYKGLENLIPRDIPSYEGVGQIVKGLMYNITFSVMLLSFTLIFTGVAKKNRYFYRPILKMLVVICTINATFCIIEFLVPPLHTFIMIKGGYGDAEYFFTFRAMSLVLNVYITGFLNMMLLSMCLNKYLTTLKKKWLFSLFIIFLVILLSGTRVAMMAGMFLVFVQIAFTKLLKRKHKVFMLAGLIIMLVSGPFALVLVKPDILNVVGTIFTLNDSSGSAQIHVYYFLRSIDMILNFPMGIGIGKADFGGFATERWINTESHAMALTIGAGIIGILIFIILNVVMLRMSRKAAGFSNDVGFVFSLGSGIFFVSVINMQMYESLLTVTLLALIYAICLVIIKPEPETTLEWEGKKAFR